MTKNEIQVFSNDQFGQVRTVEQNGKVFFCGKDVAEALGYSNTKDAVSRHCKQKGVVKRDLLTNGGRQRVVFLDEGNLYRLITHSKLPSAEQFESWVFDDVLPTLRKTGTYSVKKANEETRAMLAEARQRNARAREASLYLKLADRVTVDSYKQILIAKSAQTLSGEMLLPLPKAGKATYSAKEIGEMLGVSGKMVGQLANKHGLKTEEFGEMVWDKSPYSAHQCQTFRYYINVVAVLKQLLEVA